VELLIFFIVSRFFTRRLRMIFCRNRVKKVLCYVLIPRWNLILCEKFLWTSPKFKSNWLLSLQYDTKRTCFWKVKEMKLSLKIHTKTLSRFLFFPFQPPFIRKVCRNNTSFITCFLLEGTSNGLSKKTLIYCLWIYHSFLENAYKHSALISLFHRL